MTTRAQREATDLEGVELWERDSGGSPGKRSMTQSLAPRPIVFRVESAEAARELGAAFGPRDRNGVAKNADAAVDRAASGSGAPLRSDVRERFESSLGADLSSVRVHTGDASAEASSAVGARAYTVGNDIHFGAGQYQPDDPFGLHLLAHEVAHTQQQHGSTPHRQNKLDVSTPGDAAEADADRAADAMVAGVATRVGGGGGRAALSRQTPDPSYSRGERPAGERGGGAMTAVQFELECDMKRMNAHLKVLGMAGSLYKTATAAETKADDAGIFEWGKKNTALQVSKELTSAANQFVSLAQALLTIRGSDWASKAEGAGKGLDAAGHVLNAISTIGTVADTSALEKLKEDPSEENAEAWANQVCACFDSASKLVDALPIEVGFVKEYFTGVLSAPRGYMKAFLSIMKRRYAGIDKEADVGTSKMRYGKWTGPSMRLGQAADIPHHDLYQWMLSNMEIDGHKIPDCSYELARDLFCSKIVRDPSIAQDAKKRWLAHLQGG